MPTHRLPRCVRTPSHLAFVVAITVGTATAATDDPFGTAALAPGAPSQGWQHPGASSPCTATALAEPLLLVDALDLALCANPQTRQTWAAARAAAAQVGIARGAYLPSVTGTASAQRTDARNSLTSGVRDQATGTLSFSYLLFDFGGRDATLAQAQAALAAADWSHNVTLQSVLVATTDAYFGLHAAEEAVASAAVAEQAGARSLDAAKARQLAGAATRADVLQAQTALSQARLARMQAEGDAANARGVLANRLGLSAARPVKIAPPPDLDARRLGDAAVDRLIEAALARRPDLRAADAQVRSAEAAVRVQEAAAKPSVSVVGNLSATSVNPGLDPRSGAVGLSVNIPLFLGYQPTYRIRAAREQVEVQIANRDRLRNDVSLDVWQSYQTVRTQRESLAAATDLATSATESWELALGRYRAGAGSVTDLLNAQTALAQARVQVIQSRYRWNVAKVTLAKAIGTLDTTLFDDVRGPRPSVPGDKQR